MFENICKILLEYSMRKRSLLIIAILVSLLTACDLLKNEEIVVLKDSMESTSKSGMDINAPSISKPLNDIRVKGTVQNVSHRTLKNIVITYKIARGTVTAKISSLKPNKKSKFTTSKYKSKRSTPSYELESITYDE